MFIFTFIIICILLSVILIFLDKRMADKKKHQLLSTIGLCPFCSEVVNSEAVICKHCGNKFDSLNPVKPVTKKLSNNEIKTLSNPQNKPIGITTGIKLGIGMFIILPLVVIFLYFVFILLMNAFS